jgi:hypothetical protein
MRDVFSRSIAYRSVESFSPAANGWVQAGFSSFAYRLAHLYAPRFFMTFIVGAVFYFA